MQSRERGARPPKPARDAREDGALGAAKGAVIGLLDLGIKVSSGALGLVAFTALLECSSDNAADYEEND